MDSNTSEFPASYPLSWPGDRPRTRPGRRNAGRFATRTTVLGRGPTTLDISFDQAAERVRNELKLLQISDYVLSTNVPPAKSGASMKDRLYPKDPGVCLYFEIDGRPHAVPCDSYNRVEQNVAAIASHLASTRAIARYGVADLRAMLLFAVVPSGAGDDWRLAHKLMTRKEYECLTLKGWHMVCHDVDGCGGTGVRYLDPPAIGEFDAPDSIPAAVSTSEYEIHCDEEMVASVVGPPEQALQEARHYVKQYASEGTVEVFEVIRNKVSL